MDEHFQLWEVQNCVERLDSVHKPDFAYGYINSHKYVFLFHFISFKFLKQIQAKVS